MKWFRYYTEALHDPKVQQLPLPLFRHWVNLLCIANAGKPRGRLPDMKGVAYGLRVPLARAEYIMAQFRERGLVDKKGGRLVPHNWDARQPPSDNATPRVQRFRQRQRNEHETVQ